MPHVDNELPRVRVARVLGGPDGVPLVRGGGGMMKKVKCRCGGTGTVDAWREVPSNGCAVWHAYIECGRGACPNHPGRIMNAPTRFGAVNAAWRAWN
jgi:hypothetical protein